MPQKSAAESLECNVISLAIVKLITREEFSEGETTRAKKHRKKMFIIPVIGEMQIERNYFKISSKLSQNDWD